MLGAAGGGSVGRLVLSVRALPLIVPVQYCLDGGAPPAGRGAL